MKLLVCDVEGTIFKATTKIEGTDYPSTMWQPIAVALGEAAIQKEKETHERWDNLEWDNYLDWVAATIDIHREFGLTKEVFDALIQAAEYNEGVEQFFRELNRREFIPVLISGGFQNLIRRAQNELDIKYGFGACEYYFDDDDGLLTGYNLQPSDFEGKVHFLNLLLRRYKLNKKTDWIFVGDGKNDVDIAKQAPLAFGISPHEKLKAVDKLIEIDSFMEILPYLDGMANKEAVDDTSQTSLQTRPLKATSDENKLIEKVFRLERENRMLKQKINDQKGKSEKKQRIKQIPIDEDVDYLRTPKRSLVDLLKNRKVVFWGLDENMAAFRRLKAIKGLTVIPGMKNNFDKQKIRGADFLFIYKNCITHSDVWHACNGGSTPPCCNLGEHTNIDLLENGLANVLYKFIYE